MSPTSYRTAPPRVKSQTTLVGLGRFELPTSRLSGVRSNQLSYRPGFSCSFNEKKEPHFSRSAVRFNGGRAGGPCSFGGIDTACDLLLTNYERSVNLNPRSQI